MSIELFLLRICAVGIAAFLTLGPMRAMGGSSCGSSSGSNCLDGQVPAAEPGTGCDPATQYLSTDGKTCLNYSAACPTGSSLVNGSCVSATNTVP
jgi:hypothetical protein